MKLQMQRSTATYSLQHMSNQKWDGPINIQKTQPLTNCGIHHKRLRKLTYRKTPPLTPCRTHQIRSQMDQQIQEIKHSYSQTAVHIMSKSDRPTYAKEMQPLTRCGIHIKSELIWTPTCREALSLTAYTMHQTRNQMVSKMHRTWKPIYSHTREHIDPDVSWAPRCRHSYLQTATYIQQEVR